MKLKHKIEKIDPASAEYSKKRLFFISLAPVGFYIESSYEEMMKLELAIYEHLYDLPILSVKGLFLAMKKGSIIAGGMYPNDIGWGDTEYIRDGFFYILDERSVECVEDGNALKCLVLTVPKANRMLVEDKLYNMQGGISV
jgi:hypothetical protein